VVEKRSGRPLLIKGGRVWRWDGDPHRPDVADVLIEDDRISAVGPNLAWARRRGPWTPPAGWCCPASSTRTTTRTTSWPRARSRRRRSRPGGSYALPPQYPPRPVEEVYVRTLLGALECLRSGMTTVQDMLTLYPFDPAHFVAVMRAYDEIGIRVCFGLQYGDKKGIDTVPFWREVFPPELHGQLSSAAEAGEEYSTWLGVRRGEAAEGAASASASSMALGPSAPERCTTELMARTTDLARRLRHPGVLAHLRVARHGPAGAPTNIPSTADR